MAIRPTAIWSRLNTPEYDAQATANILGAKYGFKTTILLNATRYDIVQGLNELRKTLPEQDNLLIYYAGHGHLDKAIDRGYWVPVDGHLDSNVNWISILAITDILSAMSARHILVIADSCYAGALTRSALARLEAGMSDEARLHWLKVMAEKRSRTVLTSGDLQPVLDSGGGNHSVFAKAFLDVLSTKLRCSKVNVCTAKSQPVWPMPRLLSWLTRYHNTRLSASPVTKPVTSSLSRWHRSTASTLPVRSFASCKE